MNEPGSLQDAFAKLLERYNQLYDDLDLDDNIDWYSLTDYDLRFQVKEIGQAGTWPHTNDAIVQFKFQPAENPYVDVDGFQRANMVDSFCLLADYAQRFCVDHNGGIVEIPGYYGKPYAWASYEVNIGRKKAKPEHLHKLLKGETVWSIARRFGIPSQELIEHNDIAEPDKVPDGTILHLPVAKDLKEDTMINYELFDEAKPMHVTKAEGAKRYSFGNVREWKDIKPYGPKFPQNTNVDIVALAHVPIGKDTAAYYMDAWALGSYRDTKRVNFTIGFNHSHLAEGHVEKAVTPDPEPTPEPEPEPVVEEPVLQPVPEERASPNLFKTTYQPLPEPKLYLAEDTIIVKDFDARGVDKQLFKNKGVVVAGTFEAEGVTYGRPLPGVHNYWYGIPMDILMEEDKAYNYGVDLQTKIALKSPLSFDERAVKFLKQTISKGTKLKERVKKIKPKKEK